MQTIQVTCFIEVPDGDSCSYIDMNRGYKGIGWHCSCYHLGGSIDKPVCHLFGPMPCGVKHHECRAAMEAQCQKSE